MCFPGGLPPSGALTPGPIIPASAGIRTSHDGGLWSLGISVLSFRKWKIVTGSPFSVLVQILARTDDKRKPLRSQESCDSSLLVQKLLLLTVRKKGILGDTYQGHFLAILRGVRAVRGHSL